MQEPDSFSQSLVRCFQLLYTCTEPLIFSFLHGILFRAMASLGGTCHNTTLSWNQSPVHTPVIHRVAPPTEPAPAHALYCQPSTLAAMGLAFILVHKIADFFNS